MKIRTRPHVHRAYARKTIYVPFVHCLDPEGCNPEAHDHLTRVELCCCGHVRKINIRGRHKEKGTWRKEVKVKGLQTKRITLEERIKQSEGGRIPFYSGPIAESRWFLEKKKV